MPKELKELYEKGKWLADFHINAAMKLIKESYPTIGGL